MSVCAAKVPGGCPRPVRTRGMCDSHYKRWRRGVDTTTPVSGKYTRASCNVGACNRDAMVRGMCLAHYNRHSEGNQSTGAIMVRRKNPTTCRVCRVASTSGLSGYICSPCATKESHRTETTVISCSATGCAARWTASKHTRQRRARGLPVFCSVRCRLAVNPRVPGSTCKAPVPGGCPKPRRRGRSMCSGHISRRSKGGRMDTPIESRDKLLALRPSICAKCGRECIVRRILKRNVCKACQVIRRRAYLLRYKKIQEVNNRRRSAHMDVNGNQA